MSVCIRDLTLVILQLFLPRHQVKIQLLVAMNVSFGACVVCIPEMCVKLLTGKPPTTNDITLSDFFIPEWEKSIGYELTYRVSFVYVAVCELRSADKPQFI